MAFTNAKSLAQAASAERDSIAYIDCVFHRRYAEHLPLATLLQDMTLLKNRDVLGYVGAMAFCQRAFLQTRTHLYRIYEDQIFIYPKEYRDAVINLVDYVNARTRTTLSDLYAFCSAAHPSLVKGDIGCGLTVFKRFVEEHPTVFEIVEPAPKELDRQEVRNQAIVHNQVLLFPKIKIAVGRVVNISGNTAYLECQGEFVTFYSVSAGLATSAQLKNYLTKGDMVPFEARHYPENVNGTGGPIMVAAAGVSSMKLRNVWRALAVELPRLAGIGGAVYSGSGSSATSGANSNSSSMRRRQQTTQAVVELASPRSPQRTPFDSPVKRATVGAAASPRPSTTTVNSNSYMAPLDDALEWSSAGYSERRRSSVQQRDSSASSSAGACPGAATVAAGTSGQTHAFVHANATPANRNPPAAGLLTPPYSSIFSKHFNPFQIDAETQAGSGRPCVDKDVQTDVTDEELMLRLIRKYPNLLNDTK